ncbi:TonB-dependent receptor domain-containing protein [Aquimarina litoralis]|uniref:TonB-dependent receptor domain-containing protein n=1 Tax=Aquimarina litoralis TaxID=584605 RepID=UPI001C58FF8B|nr:TonB-dependent receptor [Aquimarina litoralis]MBW1294497.1 TonB-dependent receptor [Aquimarina litoralis]
MKNILVPLLILFTGFLQAQFNISGIIRDETSLTPISNTTILDLKTGETFRSDDQGKFDITCHRIIEFSHAGYKNKQITITKNEIITVLLSSEINQLQEVLINSLSIPTEQRAATDAVAIITKQNINRANTIELHPVLNKVPGVFMQHATLNTNRITIRGIGARNLFGTANIRTYFGDIPLTDGNGESSIEDLELGAISRIDIHKGPSSSSYGVGLGGTILLRPDFSLNSPLESSISSSVGSYGLIRNVAKVKFGGKTTNTNIIYSNNNSDGYRDNNTYNRNTLTVTSTLQAGKNNSFSLIASYIDLKAGIPSSLNQEDFNNTPRQAAFTWGRSEAFEDVAYGIFGATWTHDYNNSISHHTSIFTSFRNNFEPRPFNILKERSNTFGLRTRIIGNSDIANKQWNWNIGGELFLDYYNSKTFDNLYEDFPVGTGSVFGEQLSDLDERRNYYNLFIESNLQLTNRLKINLGVHLNQTFFDIDDNFLQNGDSSGKFDFDPIISPKLGANYTLNNSFILFGNIAHGFSTPTSAETLLPDGDFNPDIKPEVGWNYEIGTRYQLLNNKLYGSFSIYSLRVKDLLVSRRTEEDNFFAINAGRTEHNGIEGILNYQLLTSENKQLLLILNGTLNDYKFDDFVDLDNDFSGNDLTGVPSHIINVGLDYVTQKGLYGNLNFQQVGTMPANDDNTVYSDSYELLHGKIGYRNEIGAHIVYDIFLGANNIFDTNYIAQLQINARGFGGTAPRYFYPGLPFNMYGGINIKYRL